MENNKSKTTDFLLKHGLKQTPARNAILDILIDAKRPLTYDEVFLALIKDNISINISTVFRALETFSDKSIVTKINGGEINRSLYELAKEEHRHYFYCTSCREMFPITSCPVKVLVEELKREYDFDVYEHKLELAGVCKTCKP